MARSHRLITLRSTFSPSESNLVMLQSPERGKVAMPLIFFLPSRHQEIESATSCRFLFAADGAHSLQRSCKNKFDLGRAGRLCFDVRQIPADSIFFYGAAIEWSAPCDSGHSDHALSSATSLLLQATRSTALRASLHIHTDEHCLAESFDSWINYFANALWHKTLCSCARRKNDIDDDFSPRVNCCEIMACHFWSQREVMRGTRPEEQKFLRSQIKIRSESYGSAQLISNYIRKKLLDSSYMVYCWATQSEPVKNILRAHGCLGIGVNKRAVAPVWQRTSNFPGTES